MNRGQGMSKEIKIIIFVLITMTLNIFAPILVIKTVKSYTAKSYIYGTPDNTVVVSDFVKPKDYLYQENLSSMSFVEEAEYFVASYNFEAREFDLTKTYNIFINDYVCTKVKTSGKSVSGYKEISFKDVKGEVIDTTKIEVDFEFYNTYSSVLIKVSTADIQYFNGYKKNPGLIISVSETNFYNDEVLDTCTVEFKSGEQLIATKYVERFNTVSTLPTAPTKSGYTFKGWSLDMVSIVDPLTTKIQDNMVFYAVFERN